MWFLTLYYESYFCWVKNSCTSGLCLCQRITWNSRHYEEMMLISFNNLSSLIPRRSRMVMLWYGWCGNRIPSSAYDVMFVEQSCKCISSAVVTYIRKLPLLCLWNSGLQLWWFLSHQAELELPHDVFKNISCKEKAIQNKQGLGMKTWSNANQVVWLKVSNSAILCMLTQK